MVSRGGTNTARLRWVVIFALLLCALSAAPVFAASEEPSESTEQSSEAQPEGPGPEDILSALREAEKRESEREAALASPAATQEREDSETAYSDLSTSEAEQLFTATFADQLEDLEGDPARFLSGAQLDRPLGNIGATVTAEGDTQLLESDVPVRAEDEEGDLHKVDLGLEGDVDSYQPENPLVDLDIAKSAEDGLQLGEEGLGIAQAGVESSSAHRLGTLDLFYPEVATDTDLIVSPIAEGVELFDQLRSAESPDTLHFSLDLPEDAELRADGQGGAEVARGEEGLAHIPAPTAIDAQGSDVPVSLQIEGSSISLHVAPAEGEAAFPILVDPIIENWGYENWDNGYHLEALEPGTTPWTWNEGPPNWAYHDTKYMRTNFGPSGRGLYISSPSGNLPSGFAQWQYGTPNWDTYMTKASIGAFHRNDYENCPKSKYPLPYDFDGIWGDTTWNALEFNKAHDLGWTTIEAPGRSFNFGLGQGSGVSIPCWRDIAAGGVAIWLDDFHAPAINSVSGMPTGWINDVTPFTVTVNAEDAGLGVQFVNIIPQGAPVIQKWPNQCTGLSANRCPTSAGIPFVLNAGYFDNGIHSGSVSVLDPTGKTASGFPFTTKIDRTPPEVTLNGQLAQATNEVGSKEVAAGTGDQLSLPVYNLQIEAKDGSGATDEQKRSGVKSIEVFLDSKGTAEQVWTQACPESSCPMTKAYQLKLQELSAGTHVLRVITSDQVNQKLERKIEFEYMPATGISDDFVMQRFPLPEGKNPDRPELAVNVMNGNLVYRQQDVEIDGAGANLEVERYYNSMLPSAENTEWGDGWTLGQTPRLSPESGGTPKTAVLKAKSGTIRGPIDLPAETGQERFDPKLHATITKEPGGGYELADESSDPQGNLVFSSEGKVKELRTESYAKVDYAYASGKLDEIAVKDPASASRAASAEASPQAPSYASSFSGSGEATLKAPGDVAIDAEGNLWVADKANNRIERFDAKGNLLSKFGVYGTAGGQLNRPTSLAIGADGNIWVADANNNRIQEFSPTGQVLKTIGTLGSGEKQFSGPEGIAVDNRGNVWVADTANGRLQEYTEGGIFVKFVGSKSAGSGQLGEPAGIDIGPGGTVWVADWQNNRIKVFNQAGEFVRQFGEYGSANGQFKNPDAIDVDSSGNVWVSDTTNGRVQLFTQAGQYVAKFGAAGAGAGQFGFIRPTGIATAGTGTIWIADPSNNRIQRWTYPVKEANDPSVDVVTSSGLVTEVTSPEAGKEAYSYSGDDLTAQKGPDGETKYTYDTAGRMTKVQLPNGNYAIITYNTTYGRVSSVTTVIGSVSKKTSFTYSDEPRRTEVTPPSAPVVTYDIGTDGSVLRWWNAVKPPEFHDLAGSFYAGRETATPISSGDQNLVVEGYSEEGIDSVQIIANGTQLVHETTCQQDTEKPGTECVNVPSEWVTNTNNFAPGHLQLEAIITNREDKAEARRFWVNIPPPPPPLAEGTPVPPTFEEVLHFREEYGLDIVDPVSNEFERNDRIFDLIGAWWAGDSVARATAERWGVPLRTRDVEELEYRESYLAHDAATIAAWGEESAPATYAGFYIDHRAGGLMRVGFTSNQQSKLDELKKVNGLWAIERFAEFSLTPTRSLAQLRGISADFHKRMEGRPDIRTLLASGSLDIAGNKVIAGATNVNAVQQFITSTYGENGGISASSSTRLVGRKTFLEEGVRVRGIDSRLFAGDWIRVGPSDGGCTLAFGAREPIPQGNGQIIYAHYGLTAGHCYSIGTGVKRAGVTLSKEGKRIEAEVSIGTVERRSKFIGTAGFETDAEAIRLNKGTEIPDWYYWSKGYQSRINGVEPWVPGMTLCHSGTWGGTQCGPSAPQLYEESFDEDPYPVWTIKVFSYSECGDSGSPVWNPITGGAVALLTGGPGCFTGPTFDTPLLSLEGQPYSKEVQAGQSPGALYAPSMNSPNPLEIVGP